MTARARDAVGIAILLIAVVVVRLAWHALGPWICLGIAFASALAVVAVYRMRTLPGRHAGTPSASGDPHARILLRQD